MRSLILAASLALIATIAGAQQPTRILIPFRPQSPVPGAFGSLWTVTLFARNGSDTPVSVRGIFSCNPALPTCFSDRFGSLHPRETVYLWPLGGDDRPAALITIDAARAADVAFTLRVQDLSRQAQTWGTEIPVVREAEFRSATIALLDIPLHAGFRTTLRIYGVDGRGGDRVRVRAYATVPAVVGSGEPQKPERLLADRLLELRAPVPGQEDGTPSYVELGDLFPNTAETPEELGIVEIEPLTSGLRFWALVSVTNNVTQHVTTITPE